MIVSTSYDHSETFSSVSTMYAINYIRYNRNISLELFLIKLIFLFPQSLLVRGIGKSVHINKPMLTNRQRVISALIRSTGSVVNVCGMVKNIRRITTQTAKGMLFFERNEMQAKNSFY